MENGFVINEKIVAIKRNARVLLKQSKKIPEDKQDKIFKEIYEGVKYLIEFKELSDEDRQLLTEFVGHFNGVLDFKMVNNILKLNYEEADKSKKWKNLHGKVLIEKMGGEGKIPEFIKMWRQFFLDSMEPKFLPNNWSVTHSIERSFGKKSRFYEE
jgi:hypothetical protein